MKLMIIEEAIRDTQVRAQEKQLGRKCPTCKLYPFYYPHGTAVCEGHVYSKAGKSELGMTGMCEFCFDSLESPEERAERTGGVVDPDADHELPLDGQVLQTVTNLDTYDVVSGRYDTSDPEAAQVITSRTAADHRKHKVIIDLDMPAQLIPSSTEGHFHLYIDHEMDWTAYAKLLTALGEAGILEPGYVRASLERELTAVRLPWVKKPEPAAEELVEMLLDEEAKSSFAFVTPDPNAPPEKVCTCGPGKELVTRMLDAEPHFAGCPRWGTKLPPF